MTVRWYRAAYRISDTAIVNAIKRGDALKTDAPESDEADDVPAEEEAAALDEDAAEVAELDDTVDATVSEDSEVVAGCVVELGLVSRAVSLLAEDGDDSDEVSELDVVCSALEELELASEIDSVAEVLASLEVATLELLGCAEVVLVLSPSDEDTVEEDESRVRCRERVNPSV